MEKWDGRKEQLLLHYRNRDKVKVVQPMNEAIDDFITFLFILNEKPFASPENLNESMKELNYKPINLDERLLFILKKPHQYHSFIQLNELYTELLKLYAKKKILMQKK